MTMGETTHKAVVLAANYVRRAGATADADDSDGGACEPEEKVDALDGDAEQPEDGSASRGAGLWTVAR